MFEMRKQLELEQGLKEGDTVTVRWTNSHNYYEGQGTVQSIHRTRVRVLLTEAPEPYTVGQDIVVPLSGQARWSLNNRIGFPRIDDADEPTLNMSTAPIP